MTYVVILEFPKEWRVSFECSIVYLLQDEYIHICWYMLIIVLTHTSHIHMYIYICAYIYTSICIDRFDVLGHKARAFEDFEGDSTDNVYDIT
jgi:hypothetical protein